MEEGNANLWLSDFYYPLPEELIAQEPLKTRTACRLLFVDQEKDSFKEAAFVDFISALKPGDLLVLNNSKVIPARLIGKKRNAGSKKEIFNEVELFLHKKLFEYKSDEVWEVLIHGRVKQDSVVTFSDDFSAKVIEKNDSGSYLVSFNKKNEEFWECLNKYGQVPLPPYIKRSHKPSTDDKLYYQTVFANDKQAGSVAAPTAGLHFTKQMLEDIKAKGVEVAELTLHVGLGTFANIRTEKIASHKMHEELVIVKKELAKKIMLQKESGKRIVAVGTTVCRALESLACELKKEKQPFLKDYIFWTDIFIRPGYEFLLTDALLTNFHLPQSSLLILVSALVGKNKILSAYHYAVKKKFRFFSYGDVMFIS